MLCVIEGCANICTRYDVCELHTGQAVVAFLKRNVKNDKHPTEEKYPEQTKMFREIIETMYQTHLDKNADYSPYNINATGMIGIVTRFWDKTARIMNMFGFDIATGVLNQSKQPRNEPVEDSFMDSAVYSIIALIYRAGKWGK